MGEGGLLLSKYKEYDERKFDPMAFNGLRTSSLFVYSGAFPVRHEGLTTKGGVFLVQRVFRVIDGIVWVETDCRVCI